MCEKTFKEKDVALDKIFEEYRLAKLKLQLMEDQNFYPSIDFSLVKENKKYYKGIEEKYINHMMEKDKLRHIILSYEQVLTLLSFDCQLVIIKEYIEKEPKGWWVDYFSRATYYRVKAKALDQCLAYFHYL